MKKLFAKSAVALAVGLVAGQAMAAADLTFTGGIGGANGTVVLAHEIFGEGNPGVGSAETLVQMKSVLFDLDSSVADTYDALSNDSATVKFTLGQASVFGEDLSSTTKVAQANGGNNVLAYTITNGAGAAMTIIKDGDAVPAAGTAYVVWKVEQGGAIGDNTITFRFTHVTNGDADVADQSARIYDMTFRNAKIKNLQSALKPSSSSKKIEFGVEYVEGDIGDVDGVATTATDVPVVIFGSQQGVDMDYVARSYKDAFANEDGLRRINVGDDEKYFTDLDGQSAAGDFEDTKTTRNLLGELELYITTYNCTSFPQGVNCGAAPKVKKENGDDFDFQGGDKHTLTFAGVLTAFDGTSGRVYLDETVNGTCAAPADVLGNGLTDASSASASGKAVLNLVGNTTMLTTRYEVCVQANGVDVIPEEPSITATWEIDYFNARYDNDKLTAVYGPILRNGCVASFFNIPAGDNASDTAFIRMTNTSAERDDIDYDGKLYAKLYAQDGSVLASGVEIDPDLNVHETAVFTSASADVGTAKSLPVLLGANVPAGTRARLVITGAFPTCEALGLVRNSSTGILTNMTSTTQAQNQDAQYGNNGN